MSYNTSSSGGGESSIARICAKILHSTKSSRMGVEKQLDDGVSNPLSASLHRNQCDRRSMSAGDSVGKY